MNSLSPRHCQQRDLFEELRTQSEIPTDQRSTLVRLIECLLSEAAAGSNGKKCDGSLVTKGGSHEQVHT
jgi:hypothetical protein